jgi:flagellar motor switch protein FliM
VPQVLPYDFRKPSPPPPTRIDALEPLMHRFAAALSDTLMNYLRGPVHVALSGVEPMRYADFMGSRAIHTCMALLHIDPPRVHLILDCNPPAIFPVIDRLLGGDLHADNAIPARPLTQIEQALAVQVIERAAGLLADTFNDDACTGERPDVRCEELVPEPARLRIMPADEIIAVAQFAVRINEGYGSMCLAMPNPLLQFLHGSLSPSAHRLQSDAVNLRKNVLTAAVELRALLAETKLRLNEVLSMQVGDVITTDAPADQTVPLQVQGRTKFHGLPAQYDGNRAIEITGGGDSQ